MVEAVLTGVPELITGVVGRTIDCREPAGEHLPTNSLVTAWQYSVLVCVSVAHQV